MRLITLRGTQQAALSITPDQTVREAMQAMNQSGRTLLLVIADGRLAGVVADGDIRRYLARGGSTGDLVSAALNPAPTTMAGHTPLTEVRAFMARRGFEYIPLVDGDHVAGLCILERAPSATELTAVVMAGGFGSRLAPLTDDCPKPLLRVGGKPILSHIVEHLRDQGVRKFVFSVSYLAHMIIDHYDDGSRWDCFIDYVQETQRLGTGGSLSLVDAKTLSDPFLCLNGDVLHDVDIGALHDTHLANAWDATMVVRNYNYAVPYGVVETSDEGHFKQIAEKPVHAFQINAGIYMLSKSVLDLVPRNRYYDLPTLFAELDQHQLRGGTYTHGGRWIDIGTTADYNRATSIFDDEGDA